MIDKKIILIVDDDEMFRQSIISFLTRCGYEVVTALNVEETMEIVKRNNIDLIVTEMVMPKSNGIDLLKTVKASFPQTEVVIVTAYGEVESYLEAMNLGAFEYLTKPIEPSEIKKVINKIFSKHEDHKLAVI